MRPLELRIDPTPRRVWVAMLLTVVMPGLGHIYCGRVRRGLLVWLGLLGLVLGASVAWARGLFVPVGPLLVGAGAWVALQVVLGADLAREIGAHGALYRLRPMNHPLSYVAVVLGLGVLPLTLAGFWIERTWVGSLAVGDLAMFPHLLPGDRVLFERAAFADRAPEPGELVVVGEAAEAKVARVVAGAGETVELRDARPVIDGAGVEQAPIEAMRVLRFTDDEQARLDALRGYVEARGARDYVVTYDRAARRDLPRDPAPVVLADDEIFVLGDNRHEAIASRAFGRVPLDAVQGRPRYIWSSLDEDRRLRPGRVGLDVR